MLKEVTVYQTTDGKLFGGKEEAMLHQGRLDYEAKVDAFLDSDYNKYKSGVPRQFARAGILAWEAYKEAREQAQEQAQEKPV
jgi:hypothetical protein